MPNLRNELLPLILESLPTGTIVVDQGGRIVLLNQQIELWFGYSRDELLQQAVELLIPERYRPAHPQYRSEYLAAPRVRPMGVNRELYARRKDGSEFPCDISLHPLPLQDGMHVLVHIVDATSRQQSEVRQRHEESLRRLQFMVENLPAGAVYVSLEEQSLQVNRTFEQMTGYGAEELRDFESAWRQLFRERSDEMRQQLDKDRRSGFTAPRELQIVRKDGRHAWIEAAVYHYGSHEVWLWHDITDRRAIQERSLQSARLAAIGEMMTGLAHESRNALQRARAALEMLGLDLDDKPGLRELSQRAVSAVDELQRLYEEVRGYASPIQLELRSADLEDVWREAWSQVQSVHRDKHVSLTSHCEEFARHATVDPYRIQQVFRNLLENSMTAFTGPGHIDITARQDRTQSEPWIEISVQDNGPGIPVENRPRLFDPFFTTRTRGTGLGLAIVRRIMDAHGGTVTLGDSPQGTRIELRIPGHET
jgi:PAS domain S-box-containing protein